MSTIVRNTLMYNSMKVLGYIGTLLILIGLVPFVRWYILSYIISDGGMHIQSLLVGLLLMFLGALTIILGFISDLLAINRKHLEDIMFRIKKLEIKDGKK